MIQVKVTQIGNSLGIVLPKEALAHLGVAKGEKLSVVEQANGVLLTTLDPDFEAAVEVARKGMKKYRNALSELAK